MRGWSVIHSSLKQETFRGAAGKETVTVETGGGDSRPFTNHSDLTAEGTQQQKPPRSCL